MNRTTRITLALLIAFVGTAFAHAPIFTQAEKAKKAVKSKPNEAVKSKPNETGPLSIFVDIEAGWRKEDPNRILRHFGKGKVAISIDGVGPSGGQFSKSQSYYLLNDLFKYTITKKFEFVQYRNVKDGKRKVFAVAERYYKRTDDGRLFKDKIYVSLHREGERWVIDKITSIR